MGIAKPTRFFRWINIPKILEFLAGNRQKPQFFSQEERMAYEADLRIQRAKAMLPPIFRV